LHLSKDNELEETAEVVANMSLSFDHRLQDQAAMLGVDNK